MQELTEHLVVGKIVKQELRRRQILLSKRIGKKVSFDFVMKNILRV